MLLNILQSIGQPHKHYPVQNSNSGKVEKLWLKDENGEMRTHVKYWESESKEVVLEEARTIISSAKTGY